MRFSQLLQIQPNLDLSQLQFRAQGASDLNLIVLFAVLIVLLIGIGVLIFFYMRKKYRMEEMNRLREETRIKLLTSEFHLNEKDMTYFKLVTGSSSPGRYIPLLEIKTEFEEAAEAFRTENPSHPILLQAPGLRQKLGYGFGNLRNKFNDTRMLPVGSRLQCQIAQASKDIVFLTNILGSTEHNIFIRPPHSGGKPVSIAKFPTLTLKISREGDAEYEITAKVIGETPNEMKAVILEHTQDIQRLMFRNAPRIDTAVDGKFYLVKQDQAEERSHNKFKIADSSYSFVGKIKDLSIGGALVVIELTELSPQVGDWVVFKIPEAQINEDLVGEVMRLTTLEGNNLQVHLRFTGIKELDRLKMNKFLQTLQSSDTQQAAGA
ncbi:MAG: PilZ domain-containing protein [SAR324 cluster bacterium]|nr:PilZ domain-containing protein [SAR324 cluster bacterium]MCZ6629260.1 PilZ domain-containing protein [SAR324 cluster bacterium]MCZ6646217.1 PilZ domain-containing protein [SAR324 cluster bacterium]MCZ6843884.1 PilZ domain-containing protein [SAR324 cluster bacterium]